MPKVFIKGIEPGKCKERGGGIFQPVGVEEIKR